MASDNVKDLLWRHPTTPEIDEYVLFLTINIDGSHTENGPLFWKSFNRKWLSFSLASSLRVQSHL